MSEKEKYERIYAEYPQYRSVDHEADIINYCTLPPAPSRIAHVGVGASRLPLTLKEKGYIITVADIAFNCFDKEVQETVDNVYVKDLTSFDFSIGRHDFAICVDVLEHIEYNGIEAALLNLSHVAPHGIVAPSVTRSKYDLHHIVEGHQWWEDKLSKYFKLVDTVRLSTHFIGVY